MSLWPNAGLAKTILNLAIQNYFQLEALCETPK